MIFIMEQIRFQGRICSVKNNLKNEKYIIISRKRVYLSSIRYRYRYVFSSGAPARDSIILAHNSETSERKESYQLGKLQSVPEDGLTSFAFFRKYAQYEEGRDYIKDGADNELDIVQVLHHHPHKNILGIFSIEKENKFYDAELLDMNVYDLHKESFYCDLRNCLVAMHRLGIVYIDIHTSNYGWSRKDGCWKFFDFDNSGIVDSKTGDWIIKPYESENYKRGVQMTNNKFEMDFMLLDDLFKQHRKSSC